MNLKAKILVTILTSAVLFGTAHAREAAGEVDELDIHNACAAYLSGDNEELNREQYNVCVRRMRAMYGLD